MKATALFLNFLNSEKIWKYAPFCYSFGLDFLHFAVGLMEDEKNYNLICREKILKQPLFIPHYRQKPLVGFTKVFYNFQDEASESDMVRFLSRSLKRDAVGESIDSSCTQSPINLEIFIHIFIHLKNRPNSPFTICVNPFTKTWHAWYHRFFFSIYPQHLACIWYYRFSSLHLHTKYIYTLKNRRILTEELFILLRFAELLWCSDLTVLYPIYYVFTQLCVVSFVFTHRFFTTTKGTSLNLKPTVAKRAKPQKRGQEAGWEKTRPK